ncbi:diaminopimelate epimerase [Marinilabilia rubra]|uniref:Diaminopimelate epimerase n=1 Tax=Marinilabilia rubra TaxID=2162893 RepID=A0A2U2B3E2_9BACT|nr:diaminopimelate epimerase [Marinilabilia rubra]PWD97582.1 diaminopimelate epimerase [Marinilabilia rubra]
MKKIQFYKYQGTGNDFVLIDNRQGQFDGSDQSLIESLCHRRFGIGADGLMLLEKSEKSSFTMRYYNSDGRESTMCGNGGRCIAAFAVDIGVVEAGEYFSFDAVDGTHEAIVESDIVSLKMVDVEGIRKLDEGLFLDTGSPHFIKFVDDPSQIDVFKEGTFWRNHELFAPDGTNVNFVGPVKNGEVDMRTFERGVEDETWSCGTGAVASAIGSFFKTGKGNRFSMHIPGGELTVTFDTAGEEKFENIWLKGPAKFVFEGAI